MYKQVYLNQMRAGRSRRTSGFLKLILYRLSVRVHVYVYVRARGY